MPERSTWIPLALQKAADALTASEGCHYTTTEVARILGVQPGVVRQKAELRRKHGQTIGRQQPYSGDWLWTAEDIEMLRLPLPRGRPRQDSPETGREKP